MAAKKSNGFSLMEVVVALAILGIGIVAVIELYSMSLKSTKKTWDYSHALIYARSSLEEAYAMPAASEGTESFEQPDGIRVLRSIQALSKEDGMKVYEITVTVFWHPNGKLQIKGIRASYEDAETAAQGKQAQ